MKISGFTIARNIIKYNYPAKEAILSILPICDEFIVNVGESDDDSLQVIKSINSPKIKIVERRWDDSLGRDMLSTETTFALSQCKGDWAFYVQIDEVIHERDLRILKKHMLKYLDDPNVEGFRFRWFHFYGSYHRYRIDYGWFQKQERIVRNNGTIKSFEDAWRFIKKDGNDIKAILTPCFIYHYGWVQDTRIMANRRKNAKKIGYAFQTETAEYDYYDYKALNKFPIYFSTHPKVMESRIKNSKTSQDDWKLIKKKYFWNPLLWFRFRYKTFKRLKTPLPR